jgi:putative heme transporter
MADRAETERPVPSWLDRAVAIGWRVAFLIAVGFVIFLLLTRLRLIVLPVIIALVATAVLAPVVNWLEGRGVHRLLGTWMVFLGLMGVGAGFLYYLVPRLIEEFEGLDDTILEAGDEIREWLVEGPLGVTEQQIDDTFAQIEAQFEDNQDTVTEGVIAGAATALEIVVGALVAVVLTFFFVKDGPRIVGWILDQTPERFRTDAREVGERSWGSLGAYFRGVTIDGAIEGTLMAIALIVLGVPLVIPLATLTFLGGYIPFIGATLAGAITALVTLATRGPGAAIVVVLVTIAIQNLENQLLQPLVMGKVTKLHPVVVLIAVTAGGILGGIAGLFVAVPITVVAVRVATYFIHDRESPDADQTDAHPPRAPLGVAPAGVVRSDHDR